MNTQLQNSQSDVNSNVSALVEIITDMTSDWDTEFEGQIGADTRLIQDLCFESIDIVHLVVAIETKFDRRDLAFEEVLMADGRYVDELTIGQVAAFLAWQFRA